MEECFYGDTMSVTYAPIFIGTEKKSSGPSVEEQRISRQIDSLQRMSRTEREQKQGADHISEMKQLYALNYYPSTATPSFRPRVILPEAQFLLLCDATELTNDTPKTYISVGGKSDEQREKAFNAAWRLGMFNNRIFDAVLWSQFVNPSFLHLGYSPDARNGKGMVWLRALDPDTVDPDPHAKNDRDWAYVVTERYFYVDEIRRMFPERGKYVKIGAGYDDYESNEMEGSHFDLSMELPPGPLRVDAPEGFEHQRNGPRARVRYLWIKDYAKETIKEIAGVKAAEGFELVVAPKTKWKFPNGRFIVECNGIILADGPNFIPRLPEDDFGTFPLIGIWSMPHLDSLYGPPPIRYVKSPQDIAERMYTQLIENMIRTNNVQCWIPRDSNIDIDAYGGLPGEVQVYDGDKPPTMSSPPQLPQHMTQIPELLLQKVARYSGTTPERQGQAGSGNISPELFDAAVFQGQTFVRMKARLLAEQYQRLARMVFYTMARFKRSEDTLRPERKSQKSCKWLPIPDGAECDIELDEITLSAISSRMMQTLALNLSKTGMLPAKFVLETLGIPNAEEIASEGQQQMALSALSKLRKPR
jgi:hypothetical protein